MAEPDIKQEEIDPRITTFVERLYSDLLKVGVIDLIAHDICSFAVNMMILEDQRQNNHIYGPMGSGGIFCNVVQLKPGVYDIGILDESTTITKEDIQEGMVEMLQKIMKKNCIEQIGEAEKHFVGW